ncbi:MDIS1-interacting receptor like kinase 2-like isoform X1 [Prosopis cineraria]|uniref:MDIS1-interacting receptor like kinase 2-like isoform X1 n=1 Tax=Prosopis cineraria TaxID=364024 RepID=UPI00240EF78F|nr:MDIS1-interacting receptor like kinase 2-like isoform X1 [Prosopis cineraria]
MVFKFQKTDFFTLSLLLTSWQILCIFFFCVFAIFSSSLAATEESNALLKWKSSLAKPSQAMLSSWNGTDPCNHWKGITCNESMSVSTINLTSMGIQDQEYQEAHITDFGIAKFLKLDSNNMTSFAGTYGYVALEIAFTMQANEKCDVYSFEVLTLEILMGRHPGEFTYSLAKNIPTSYNLSLKDVLDQRLPPPSNQVVKEVMLIAKIAFACLNDNPQCRPTMEQVSLELVRPKPYSMN